MYKRKKEREKERESVFDDRVWSPSVSLRILKFLIRRGPPQEVCVNSQQWLAILSTFHVLLDNFRSDTDDMLSLPIFDHIESL